MFTTIINVKDISVARVLIVALKAHGFNPLEGEEAGLPAMPGVISLKGEIPIKLPQHEAEDAAILAKDLVKQMID
jgi:hypothetical protein